MHEAVYMLCTRGQSFCLDWNNGKSLLKLPKRSWRQEVAAPLFFTTISNKKEHFTGSHNCDSTHSTYMKHFHLQNGLHLYHLQIHKPTVPSAHVASPRKSFHLTMKADSRMGGREVGIPLSTASKPHRCHQTHDTNLSFCVWAGLDLSWSNTMREMFIPCTQWKPHTSVSEVDVLLGVHIWFIIFFKSLSMIYPAAYN